MPPYVSNSLSIQGYWFLSRRVSLGTLTFCTSGFLKDRLGLQYRRLGHLPNCSISLGFSFLICSSRPDRPNSQAVRGYDYKIKLWISRRVGGGCKVLCEWTMLYCLTSRRSASMSPSTRSHWFFSNHSRSLLLFFFLFIKEKIKCIQKWREKHNELPGTHPLQLPRLHLMDNLVSLLPAFPTFPINWSLDPEATSDSMWFFW